MCIMPATVRPLLKTIAVAMAPKVTHQNNNVVSDLIAASSFVSLGMSFVTVTNTLIFCSFSHPAKYFVVLIAFLSVILNLAPDKTLVILKTVYHCSHAQIN